MKSLLNNKMKKILLTISLLFACNMIVLAQDPPDFDDDVNDVPVDGGASLLAATAVAYGLRKMYHKNKDKAEL
jgi:hypothetical protein